MVCFYNEINQSKHSFKHNEAFEGQLHNIYIFISLLNHRISRHDIIDNSLTCFEYVIMFFKKVLHNAAIITELIYFWKFYLYIFEEKKHKQKHNAS